MGPSFGDGPGTDTAQATKLNRAAFERCVTFFDSAEAVDALGMNKWCARARSGSRFLRDPRNSRTKLAVCLRGIAQETTRRFATSSRGVWKIALASDALSIRGMNAGARSRLLGRSLIADRPPRRAAEAGAAPFNADDPSFRCCFAALLRAPTITPATVLCGIVGFTGAVYAVITARRVRKQAVYQPEFEDRLFHFVLPPSAYVISRYHLSQLYPIPALRYLLSQVRRCSCSST
jgi:hypothetical protein